MFASQAQRPRQLIALAAALAGGACHSGTGPSPRTVLTAAAWDALPRYHLADGQFVCLGTGYTACPQHLATANWIDDTSFVLWAPGRVVGLWTPHDTAARVIGASDTGQQRYGYAVAAGPAGRSIVVIDGNPPRALYYDRTGRFQREKPASDLAATNSRAFIGRYDILQQLVPHGADQAAHLVVRVTSSPADTDGRTILDTPVPWLRMVGTPQGAQQVGIAPFFAPMPAYTLTANGDLVWSPGDRLALQRIGSNGTVAWTIAGNLQGPAITPADVARQRAALDSTVPPTPDTRAEIDSMAARTGSHLPAVSTVLTNGDGFVLAAAGAAPTDDSVSAVMVAPAGTPMGRLQLGAKDRLLLYHGDSVLVFRPGTSEPWEVRWLRLVPPR
jgi:hypothetical protein